MTPNDKPPLEAEEPWKLPRSEKRRPRQQSVEAYLRWASQLSQLPSAPKPVRFIGDKWKM